MNRQISSGASVYPVITVHIAEQHLWSDSTIALSWIGSSPHLWKTFVANRTSEIQELTRSGKWHHVSSKDNPADVLSRGTSLNELKHHHLWWHSPIWLSQDKKLWDIEFEPATHVKNFPDSRPVVTTHMTSADNDDLFERYSSLSQLLNVVAYCLRFKANCLNKLHSVGPLQVSERDEALICLIKKTQSQAFATDFQRLSGNKQLYPKSKLLSLSPFIDQGILKVGGRLANSNVSPHQKHPILLPSSHPFTTLLITREHLRQLHTGTESTLASVRLKYWPISGRQATKKIIRNCFQCFRARPRAQQQFMGDLLASRISPCRPFSISGVDFAGPFQVREGGRRSKRSTKAYVALFICFATKTIHLELVSDLSTEAFLGCLKRFVSRRGKCSRIVSDNATNFVGANRELLRFKNLLTSESRQQQVTTYLAEEGIVWEFIPPYSPYFGGLWEAGVKATKHHLRRVLGNTILTFEEVSTLLAQIESCLNSRPITPLSTDPSDLAVLTHGHFLIGEALTSISEPPLLELKINHLSRWQRVQQLFQHIWLRWSREYLSLLQQRTKWKNQRQVY